MIKIDGIAKRNLQEQVGFNSEQIDKIFELLDGLNVQDNLIKLTASSGTLSAEQMAVVEKDVAFIIYNNNLYIKTTTSASEYTFKQVALSASDQGTYNILQSFRIVITRANGAYLYSSNTVLSLYNKSEIDSLLSNKADSSALTSGLALKANVAGQAFTGEITAPSIIETMSDYSCTKMNNAYWTNIYTSVVKNGNKLTVVCCGSILKSSDTPYNFDVIRLYMPQSVADKIVAMYGSTYATAKINLNSDDVTSVQANCVVKKDTPTGNNIRFVIAPTSSLTNGTTYYFRIELTVLLSDNLVS